MKNLPGLLCSLTLCLLPCATFAQSKDVTILMTQAQRAVAGGDRPTAKVLFKRVLELEPNNLTAQRYLRTIELAEGPANTGGTLKSQLDKLMVDKIEFKDTSLDSVLQYLSHVAKQKNVNLSFVAKLPPDFSKTTKITLSLGTVPMTVVMQYVGSLSGTAFKMEQYAVSVELASAQATTTETAPLTDTKIPGL